MWTRHPRFYSLLTLRCGTRGTPTSNPDSSPRRTMKSPTRVPVVRAHTRSPRPGWRVRGGFMTQVPLFSRCFHAVFTLFSRCFHAVFTLFSRCFHAVFTRFSCDLTAICPRCAGSPRRAEQQSSAIHASLGALESPRGLGGGFGFGVSPPLSSIGSGYGGTPAKSPYAGRGALSGVEL